ncbi:MAG: hypothetical protein VB049_07385 [Candidatus Pelethousia sp.]|nr:hypothetical protein [Candidatus Pelethousia sp.]
MAILITGGIAALYLTILIKGNIFIGDSSFFGDKTVPSIGKLGAGTLLWVLFALLAFTFIFVLFAEILLVKRRLSGLMMLLLAYAFHIASATITLIKYQAGYPWTSYIVAVVGCILIMVYYWKRRHLFN